MRALSRGTSVSLVLGLVIISAFSAGIGAPVAADCGGGTFVGAGNASAGGWCATEQPPRREGLTTEQLWNAYCVPHTRPYRGTVNVENVANNPDGTQTITTETFTDSVSFEHEYDHPYPGLDGQFDFMVLMGWDPTSVVEHYTVVCTGHEVSWRSGITEAGGAVHFTIVDPVPVETLRDNALAKITFNPPGIGSAPPTSRSIVNLSNWLWVDTEWVTLSDSDSQGAVTVTVEARPVDVTWTFDDNQVRKFAGDGTKVCDDPGEVWHRGADDNASDCQYTFRYPSAWNDDGVFHGSATVRWELTWSLNDDDQGVFGEMTRTTPFDVNVVEIQTVGEAG